MIPRELVMDPNVAVKVLNGTAVLASTTVARSHQCICSQRLQTDRFVQQLQSACHGLRESVRRQPAVEEANSNATLAGSERLTDEKLI
jgi:hypothetical protein